MDPAPLKVVSDLRGLAFLGEYAHLCHVTVALHPHHHPITAGPGIVRLPLVGLSRLAGLGGLLDNRPCRHAGDHLHLSGGHDDHPGVANHLLRYGPGPPIFIPPYHPPGHLHLEDVGLVVCPRAVSAPGHPAGIVSLDRTQLTNTSYASVSTMATNIHVILQSQLSAEKVQKLFADLLDPPALSHYADPLPESTPSNQLVPYDPTAASSSAAPSGINVEPLETHGLFLNYQSFHRLSGDQDKEACTAANHDLTNLMLSQTPEEVSLINVSSCRPKPEGTYSSFFAATDELKKKQDKIHLQWPPLQTHNKVIKRTLSLYQHGPQPKSGTSNQWPPPPVRNPWDKDFVPKDFPTTYKIPSNMPKLWYLHASPLMLRPPQSTAVTEVTGSDIMKCPSWLEAFAARYSRTSTMSATSMGGVYNFLLKISRFLRASAAKNNIQKDITLVDDLIQRANSMALEAHLMAHDAQWLSSPPVSPVLVQSPVVSTPAIMGYSNPVGCRLPHIPPLVPKTKCDDRCSVTSSGTQPVLLHGCISQRMGRQLERPSDFQPMVRSGIPTSYQLAGTGSHTTCVTSLGTSVAKSIGESLLRQQYGSSVHRQIGRNTFSVLVSQNSGTVRSPGSVCDNSSPYTSSRSQERYGRCSVPNQSTQPNWMAHPNRNLEQSVLCLRNSPDRHVCHSGEQGHARLCFSLPGRQSMGGRCPVPILGRFGTSLCISSGSHCPQNSPENPKISRHHGHHDCVTTSIPTVAPSSSTVEHTSSNPSPGRQPVPVCAQPQTPPISPRSKTIGSSRVEIIRDVLKSHHFPDTVVDMAANPLRDSSCNVYNSH